MRALLKKNIWVINLALLALIAWRAAATVNALTASALFVVPKAPVASTAGDAGSTVASLGRLSEPGTGADLQARRIFDLNPAEDDGGGISGDDGPEDDDEGDDTEAEGDLQESELPMDLIGTLVSPDPETSMATLSVEGENKLAWIGTEFLDGKATVVTIAPRHIIVKESAGLRIVKLWADKKPEPPAAGRGPKVPPRPARPAAAQKTDGKANYKDHVRKTGPYSYEIDRSMLDEQLQDLSKLGTQARVVPNYRNGKYEGFKLVGVRPGSLYRAIGVRSGDVIKSINGSAIDSPNKALDLFEKLKNSSHIDLDIERRGQPKQFAYDIK